MKKKGKRDNSHNYSEIARMMGLKHRTSDPVVGKILKPKPITKEDEERVAKKLTEDQIIKAERAQYYKGFPDKQAYKDATPESRKRREIIFGIGSERKRMAAIAHQEWLRSKRPMTLDIKTPSSKDNDKVDAHIWSQWEDQDQKYYSTFTLLWNKAILKEGNLNPVSYESKRDPKYDYLTNGTHYKGITKKKPLDLDKLREYVQEIKDARYAARTDVMNGHVDFKILERGKDDDLGSAGDSANEGFSTRWIEENIGTDHPDDYMRTEGLIDVDVAKGLAEHDGVQTAVLYLSNVYAEDSDLSTPHLTDLNCIRFSTSVAQITAEARRRNNRAKAERQKVVSLEDLDKIVNTTSERVASYTNTYTRKLEVKYKGDYKAMVTKVVGDLKKALNQIHNDSPIAREMIFINYGLILASLFKKVNKGKQNERKN